MDIVTVDVPALLGLDVLDGENLYADNLRNRLVHRQILSGPGEPLVIPRPTLAERAEIALEARKYFAKHLA